MAFHEVQFPPLISFGAVGGAEFKTTIVTLDSGHERRNIDWSIARGEWDVVHGLEDQADIDTLIAFFRVREGRAHGFRFRDWADYTLSRQNIGTTDGSTATFQIFKRYTSLVNYDRPITKIVSDADADAIAADVGGSAMHLSVWVNNALIIEGAGVSEFQINRNDGIITLGSTLAAQSATEVEVECEFDVPVRFNLDRMNVTISFHDIYDWPVPVIEIRDIV